MILNIIKKLIFAILLGSFLTIIVIQNQKDFQIFLKNKITNLAQTMLNCQINFDVYKVNLFSPTIELENIRVKENNNEDWQWKAKKLKIKCYWPDYIFKKKFNAIFDFEEFEANSKIKDSQIAILPHIKKLILGTGSSFPLAIKKLNLLKSKIHLYDADLNLQIDLEFKNELKQIDNDLKINFYLTNGKILKDKVIYSQEISGNILIRIPTKGDQPPSIELNGLCNLPILKTEDDRCYFFGKWLEANKFLNLHTIDGKLNVGPITFFEKNHKLFVKLEAESSINYIQKFVSLPIDLQVDGNCIVKVITDINKETLKGKCILKNPRCNLLPKICLNEIKLDFSKKNDLWSGQLQIEKDNDFILQGKCNFNQSNQTGILSLNNKSEIFLTKDRDWLIAPQASLNLNIDKNQEIKSNYSCSFSNQITQKRINSKGKITYSKNSLKINGTLGKQKYELESQLKPNFVLKKLIYLNDEQNEVIKIKTIEQNKAKIVIYFEHIKNWLSYIFNQKLIGQGAIILEGQYLNEKFIGKIYSKNLNITIAKTYNLIKEIQGSIEIDFPNKQIKINNIFMKMYKGEIECKNGIFIFNGLSQIYNPKFIYLPISINNCFANWKKDIFATISGKLLLQKINDNELLKLSGFLLINNANIKNNIFSDEFRNNLLNHNLLKLPEENSASLEINLAIANKNPIKMTTSLLKTQGNINLLIQKNVLNPDISGDIELIDGTISFPYKDLNIINGKLHFVANQSYDPIINLTARNKIKKWNVTLHVTGSAQNQIIKFESSPPLAEEQIISLLLVGSESSSMNTAVPALVMNNLKNIISGSSDLQSQIKKYFDKFLKPMKYIKFVPRFSDETGRSGFKGAIEIDDNNRLHALIEKSFNLIEDTRFEVDYSLTDDVSIRGIKDERGDLGGEMEIRWKF